MGTRIALGLLGAYLFLKAAPRHAIFFAVPDFSQRLVEYAAHVICIVEAAASGNNLPVPVDHAHAPRPGTIKRLVPVIHLGFIFTGLSHLLIGLEYIS